jgi:hypothetical protein
MMRPAAHRGLRFLHASIQFVISADDAAAIPNEDARAGTGGYGSAQCRVSYRQ